MKLYADLKSKPGRHALEYASEVVSDPATVLVDIANVAKYYSQRGEKRLSVRDFPKTLSPWRKAFFEHPYFGVKGVDEAGIKRLIDRYGHWVRVIDRKDEPDGFDDLVSSFGPVPFHALEVRFIQIIYSYELHHRHDGRRPIGEGRFVLFYDHDGEILTPNPGGLAGVLYAPRLAHDPQTMQSYMTQWFYELAPLFLSISLAHCKNVSIAEREAHVAIPKRGRAPKEPSVKYKTLVIDAMKQTLRTEGGIAKNGLKKALHICRGHFATYTADKPLFGKITGTVWKPMHTRGTKSRGEVKKDYRIDAPAE